jgi:hypothetical protein
MLDKQETEELRVVKSHIDDELDRQLGRVDPEAD